MKLQNIGGATALIEHNGKRMLFDPWMDEGIFHGAWYHFPPIKVQIEDLGRLDYIYISHIHEDHCSAGTLKYLNEDAEIIIMDKKPNFVLKFLDNHQFKFKKIHLVKPQSPIHILPDLMVDMLEGNPQEPMTFAIDSTLILKWDEFVLVNANDCTPYPAGMDYILSNYQKIDLALLPYSGGSGYPSCYINLSETEKLEEKDRIISNRLQGFVNNVNYLKPKYVIPFADQYIVGGFRAGLNKFISHPTGPGVLENFILNKEFNSEMILLNSGQWYDFKLKEKSPSASYQHFTDMDKQEHINKLKEKKYDFEYFKLNPNVPLEKLILIARMRLWKMQQTKNYFPNYNLYLDANDLERRFKVDLSKENHEEISYFEECKEPFLKVSVPGTLLMLLLVGHVSWNIADAALFIDYERKPNVYDGKIYEFINYLRI